VGLFPALFFAGERLGFPFDWVVLPFLAVCFLAGWPYLSGRATYTFWVVAMVVFFAGGVLAILLLHLLRFAPGLAPR
jgi:hypothetical protein